MAAEPKEFWAEAKAQFEAETDEPVNFCWFNKEK